MGITGSTVWPDGTGFESVKKHLARSPEVGIRPASRTYRIFSKFLYYITSFHRRSQGVVYDPCRSIYALKTQCSFKRFHARFHVETYPSLGFLWNKRKKPNLSIHCPGYQSCRTHPIWVRNESEQCQDIATSSLVTGAESWVVFCHRCWVNARS